MICFSDKTKVHSANPRCSGERNPTVAFRGQHNVMHKTEAVFRMTFSWLYAMSAQTHKIVLGVKTFKEFNKGVFVEQHEDDL